MPHNQEAAHNLVYGDVTQDRYAAMRFKISVDLIKDFIKDKPKVSILDIGCYTGDILQQLPKGITYFGVDVDPEALKIARQRGATVFNIDLESGVLDFGGKKFDVIIATELLEHLKDPQRLLSRARELLNPDGAVLISLPNECTLYHRLKVLAGAGIDGTGFAPHYHMHFPTLKQNNEFVGTYFKIEKKVYWIHADPGGPLGKVLRIIPDAFWRFLARISPGLFARGVIYVARRKETG